MNTTTTRDEHRWHYSECSCLVPGEATATEPGISRHGGAALPGQAVSLAGCRCKLAEMQKQLNNQLTSLSLQLHSAFSKRNRKGAGGNHRLSCASLR